MSNHIHDDVKQDPVIRHSWKLLYALRVNFSRRASLARKNLLKCNNVARKLAFARASDILLQNRGFFFKYSLVGLTGNVVFGESWKNFFIPSFLFESSVS